MVYILEGFWYDCIGKEVIAVKTVSENDNREFDVSKFKNVPRDTSPDHEMEYLKSLYELKESFQKKDKAAS